MKVVFAKHPCCETEFLFMVPYGMRGPAKGDVMLVNTMHGNTVAIASSNVIEAANAEEIAARVGAYLPLKPVLEVCGPVLRQYIEREVRKEDLRLLENRLDDRNWGLF